MNKGNTDQRSSSATENMAKKIANAHRNGTNQGNSYEIDSEKKTGAGFRIVKMYICERICFQFLSSYRVNNGKQKPAPHYQDPNQANPQLAFGYGYKYLLNQLNLEADEFKKNFGFIDKEKLFMDLQSTKQELNYFKDENHKIKTKLMQTEKDVSKYEKIVEEVQYNAIGMKTNKASQNQVPQLLLMNLRKQHKDLQHDLKEKTKEVDQIKKNVKVTRMQELEVERKSYFDETIRLKQLIEQAAIQLHSMSTRLNTTEMLEQEISKAIKQQEKMNYENQLLQNQLQQSEDTSRQLQHLYKGCQSKCASLQQSNQSTQQQCKKLQMQYDQIKNEVKAQKTNNQVQQQTKQQQQTNWSQQQQSMQHQQISQQTKQNSSQQQPSQQQFHSQQQQQLQQEQKQQVNSQQQPLSQARSTHSVSRSQIKIKDTQLKKNLSKPVISSTKSIKSSVDKKSTSNANMTQDTDLFAEELRYKLILRAITWEQIGQILDGLKQQADSIPQQIKREDLKSILTQEPFAFEDENRINAIVDSLEGEGHDFIDSFQAFIGPYKTFHDFSNFNLDDAERVIIESLQDNQQEILEYWQVNEGFQNTGLKKNDIQRFIDVMQFKWDEATILFYYLNIFERSDEKLEGIHLQYVVNPFYGLAESDDQQQQDNHPQPINEDSDEGLFDNQSQDYSLDEKRMKQYQQNPHNKINFIGNHRLGRHNRFSRNLRIKMMSNIRRTRMQSTMSSIRIRRGRRAKQRFSKSNILLYHYY